MSVLLVWNGYSQQWDTLVQGTHEVCLETYNRKLAFYKTGIKMKLVEM